MPYNPSVRQVIRVVALLAVLGLVSGCSSGPCPYGVPCERPSVITSVALTASSTGITAEGELHLITDVYFNNGGFGLDLEKVEFYDGSSKIAEDTTRTYEAPYRFMRYEASITVTKAMNGTHSLTARAIKRFDDSQYVSEPVVVTVNIP